MPSLPSPTFLTTTSNAFEGYDVVQTLGVVRGIVVRSRSIFGNIGAGFQTIFGGNISILAELCERTRADAFAHAIEHAKSLGANGMVAIRYDATEIMSGVSEVLCYGTAVRVAPQLRRTLE
ncbi:MAG: YbjQ family protein [Gemmatimonadaceae bacterium]